MSASDGMVKSECYAFGGLQSKRPTVTCGPFYQLVWKKLQLPCDQVVERLAFADDTCVCSIDEDLGGEWARIVVRCHYESISSSAEQGDGFTGLKIGQLPVLAEEIATFADGANDIDLAPFSAGLLKRGDLVMTFVERGADQVVHARIHHLESLCFAALFVETFRKQHACVADNVAAGFEQDLEAEIFQPWDEGLAVFRNGQRAFLVGLGCPPSGRA